VPTAEHRDAYDLVFWLAVIGGGGLIVAAVVLLRRR